MRFRLPAVAVGGCSRRRRRARPPRSRASPRRPHRPARGRARRRPGGADRRPDPRVGRAAGRGAGQDLPLRRRPGVQRGADDVLRRRPLGAQRQLVVPPTPPTVTQVDPRHRRGVLLDRLGLERDPGAGRPALPVLPRQRPLRLRRLLRHRRGADLRLGAGRARHRRRGVEEDVRRLHVALRRRRVDEVNAAIARRAGSSPRRRARRPRTTSRRCRTRSRCSTPTTSWRFMAGDAGAPGAVRHAAARRRDERPDGRPSPTRSTRRRSRYVYLFTQPGVRRTTPTTATCR